MAEEATLLMQTLHGLSMQHLRQMWRASQLLQTCAGKVVEIWCLPVLCLLVTGPTQNQFTWTPSRVKRTQPR